MIDTITFDFWETLMIDSAGYEGRRRTMRIEAMLDVLDNSDLNITYEELSSAFDRYRIILYDTWLKRIDVNTEGQVRGILKFMRLKDEVDDKLFEELCDGYAEAIFRDPPEVMDGVKHTLEAVSEMGLKIGLICNTGMTPGKVLRRVMEENNIIRHFKVLVFSDEFGIRKPDKRIFMHCLNQLDSEPETSLHIGDNIETDVGGAKLAGMKAVWLNHRGKECEGIRPDAEVKEIGELVEGLKG